MGGLSPSHYGVLVVVINKSELFSGKFVMYFEFSCCLAKYCHIFKFVTFDIETLVFNVCLLLSGLGNQIPTHRKVLSKLEIMIPTKIL